MSDAKPPVLSSGTIQFEAHHQAPGAIRCYTIWDHQLTELEALPAAGVQTLATLATTVASTAIGILATSATPSATWVGTAWGCGLTALLLWGIWFNGLWRRHKIVKQIRHAPSDGPSGLPPLPSSSTITEPAVGDGPNNSNLQGTI